MTMVVTSSEWITGLTEFVKKKKIRFTGLFIFLSIVHALDLINFYRINFFLKSFLFFIVAMLQQSNKRSLIKVLFITKISNYYNYMGISYSEDSNDSIS